MRLESGLVFGFALRILSIYLISPAPPVEKKNGRRGLEQHRNVERHGYVDGGMSEECQWARRCDKLSLSSTCGRGEGGSACGVASARQQRKKDEEVFFALSLAAYSVRDPSPLLDANTVSPSADA